MTGKQTAVLWLGLLLIGAQFYFGGQFKALFGSIKSGGPSNSPSKRGPSGKSPSGNNLPISPLPPVVGP